MVRKNNGFSPFLVESLPLRASLRVLPLCGLCERFFIPKVRIRVKLRKYSSINQVIAKYQHCHNELTFRPFVLIQKDQKIKAFEKFG
jgi:hypothetical protein